MKRPCSQIPGNLEATVNLATLYWRAAGAGRSAPGSLPREFLRHARQRLHELLESATQRFADRAQIPAIPEFSSVMN
jgi:hypothetical protein